MKKIVDQLIECDAFIPSTATKHASFTFKKNLIKTLDEKKVKHWMTEQFSKLVNPEVPEREKRRGPAAPFAVPFLLW